VVRRFLKDWLSSELPGILGELHHRARRMTSRIAGSRMAS
jgi:hypothetical protein